MSTETPAAAAKEKKPKTPAPFKLKITDLDFTAPPHGMAFAGKYAESANEIGIFPARLKQKIFYELPSGTSPFFFARSTEADVWAAYFNSMKPQTVIGPQSEVRERLLCAAHTEDARRRMTEATRPPPDLDAKVDAVRTACFDKFDLSGI
jgi:hypothetical protein